MPGPLWVRPWRAFRRYLLFWLAQGVVAGGYLWLYLSRATIDASESKPAGDYVELVKNMVLRTFLPGLLGGPLDWYATPEASLVSWSKPPSWMEWTSWVVAFAVVVGSTLLIRGAWRAWVLLAVFLAISVTLVARARLGLVGPFIGRDHRYLTDAALFGVVCLALALFPLRPGLDRALYGDPPPVADEDDEEWPEAAPDRDVDGYDTSDAYVAGDEDDEPDEELPRRRPSRVRAVLMARARFWHDAHASSLLLYGTLVMAMVTVGGVISSEQYMKTWEQNPAPGYFFNLEYGLKDSRHPHPVFMFDQAVPPLIMTPTFESERMLSHVTKVFGDDAPVFGWWSPRFLIADDAGQVAARHRPRPAGDPAQRTGLQPAAGPGARRVGHPAPAATRLGVEDPGDLQRRPRHRGPHHVRRGPAGAGAAAQGAERRRGRGAWGGPGGVGDRPGTGRRGVHRQGRGGQRDPGPGRGAGRDVVAPGEVVIRRRLVG